MSLSADGMCVHEQRPDDVQTKWSGTRVAVPSQLMAISLMSPLAKAWRAASLYGGRLTSPERRASRASFMAFWMSSTADVAQQTGADDS